MFISTREERKQKKIGANDILPNFSIADNVDLFQVRAFSHLTRPLSCLHSPYYVQPWTNLTLTVT